VPHWHFGDMAEGGEKHKKGVELCFQKLFFLTKQQLFSRSESDRVQSLTRVQSLSAADRE